LASLRAKRRLYGSPVEVLNKILSLTGFVILMAAGWIGLCYIKAILEKRPPGSARSGEAAMAQVSVQPQVQPAVSLVYAARADTVYYHKPNHVTGNGERSALSEEAARHLGLKPCPICLRGEAPQSQAEIERRGASESPK